jgi:hypothetical protein
VAIVALAALFFSANVPLLAGWATERVDGKNFFAPFYSYLAEVVRSGHWLLWNPFSNAGSPDFAEPQIGALSPLTLGWAWFAGPGALAFRLYWLTLWLLGGIGLCVHARALGAPVWGRFLAGMGFVFSGYYMGHAQHLSVVHSASFLPWIVWRFDRALGTGRRQPALEAAALWGLSALAGNPALTVSTALFLAAFAAARVIGSGVKMRTALVALAIVAAVGAVVLAPAIFSFRYESLGYSDRSAPLPREMVLASNAIEPAGLAAIFNPALPMLTRGVGEMSPIYFGAAPLLLAVLALATPGAARWKWSLCAVALLFLGLTLGTSLPLRGWLYDLVPPTRYFRHPNMFRIYFIFAILVLSVVATKDLARTPRSRGALAPSISTGRARPYSLVTLLMASVGIGVPVIFQTRSAAALLHAALVWGGLAAAVLAARSTLWRPRLPALLAGITALDLLGAHHLSAECAFDFPEKPIARAVPARSPVELGASGFARGGVAAANDHLYRHEPAYCSYAAMLNVQHMLTAESGALMAMATGHERLWFAPEVVEAPLTDDALALLSQETARRCAPVLLLHTRASLLDRASQAGAFAETNAPSNAAPPLDAAAFRRAPSAVRVPFEVQCYRADDLSLEVTCPTDGWLLITDRWSRSWRGTVNGVEVPIDGGNFFFRLVPVRAGVNVVAMEFRPFLLWPLLAVSWGTLLAVAVAAALRALRRRLVRVPAFHPHPLPCAVSS